MVYKIPTWYYRQFDADYTLDVPAEGYGGWQKELLPIEPDKTAVAIMHAWDCGTYEQYPGWYRAVEYIPRANEIAETVFPPLLSKIRSSGMKLFHVAAKGYGENYHGYKITLGICKKYSTIRNNWYGSYYLLILYRSIRYQSCYWKLIFVFKSWE